MIKKESNKMCPLFKKPCIEHKCAWYIQVRGLHPQTGEEFDRYDCTMVIQPILLIENSQQQRQTGAAIESLRNEMVRFDEVKQQMYVETMEKMGSTLLLGGVK